ncbi:MAG: DNA mismatch repair protein MutS [Crocinitomicaceae bacterium]|nr:DNA mismatch repair protein MutS [Crocinitomicaceae bacterium]|tara:strand:- start:54 stop:1811 length:1758 start_codon:yes stop_codon:yes gene_type:complete
MKAKETYKELKKDAQSNLAVTNKKIRSIVFLRLITFLFTSLFIYLFIEVSLLAIFIGLFGSFIFIVLVKKNGTLNRKKKYYNELISINNKEFMALSFNYSFFDNGNEFKDSNHFFSNDIDLFGDNSFFQCLNRTQTFEGKQLLAENLISNDIDQIIYKQEAIKELKSKTKWRQNFSALGSLVPKNISTISLLNELQNHKTILNPNIIYILWLFPITSSILLCMYGYIPNSIIAFWFFIGLGFVGYYVKKTNDLVKKLSKFENGLKEYADLILLIENTNFESKKLNDVKLKISSEINSASVNTKKLFKIISQLNNRHNLIIGFLGNGFALWDLQYVYQFEKWLKNNLNNTVKWFEAVHEIDSLIGMGTYAFNHDYIFPVIEEKSNQIQSECLAHPLIHSDKSISNNYDIKFGDFQIITGANMAGKSTFLRTISIAILSANCGLPVCAKSFNYSPIKLITSMRSSDSLSNEESYFFSELKRLRFIIDELKNQPYFIVLDEILKGTNSKDKEEGSKKFVGKLIDLKSTGVIATHDLSLCKMAEQNEQVINMFFDAEIVDGELFFDYQFKEGVCQNMNASYLLEKMGIT